MILRKTITGLCQAGVRSFRSVAMIRFRWSLAAHKHQRPTGAGFHAERKLDMPRRQVVLGVLKSGMNAMRMPLDNLYSNWVYLTAASLAWTLKSWSALVLPADGRKPKEVATRKKLLGMEFRTFLQALVMVPAQVLESGRRIVVRLLNVNLWTETFFRLYEALRRPLLE